jgi:hypothetical protein
VSIYTSIIYNPVVPLLFRFREPEKTALNQTILVDELLTSSCNVSSGERAELARGRFLAGGNVQQGCAYAAIVLATPKKGTISAQGFSPARFP